LIGDAALGIKSKAAGKSGQMKYELDSYQMHYEIFGDRAGEPLLWLSGWSGAGGDWKYIFREAPSGFRLIGPDLRGNGASTGFEGRHSFKQSARDVFALLDHLGVRRVKAIGLSGGGIVLLHMAIQQPERLDTIIAISAPPRFPEQARAIQRQFSFESLPEAEKARMRERCKGGERQIEWLVKQGHAMAEPSEDVNFTQKELATITARTLIVFGDSDPLYPLGLAVELKESIPRASLWIVPNGGHGPVFGSLAAAFAETATSFLKSGPPKP
jgi:pimeloyl-ACP methyl ester carboxylesterase